MIMAISLNSLNSMNLEFGDRIAVSSPGLDHSPVLGVFVRMTDNQLIWIAEGPESGDPSVLYTNLDGATIEKLT